MELDALLNQNRRVPNLKNRVDEATEQAVVKFATLDNPAFGQVRVSNELRKQVFLFQQVVCVLFGYAIISLTLNSV